MTPTDLDNESMDLRMDSLWSSSASVMPLLLRRLQNAAGSPAICGGPSMWVFCKMESSLL